MYCLNKLNIQVDALITTDCIVQTEITQISDVNIR